MPDIKITGRVVIRGCDGGIYFTGRAEVDNLDEFIESISASHSINSDAVECDGEEASIGWAKEEKALNISFYPAAGSGANNTYAKGIASVRYPDAPSVVELKNFRSFGTSINGKYLYKGGASIDLSAGPVKMTIGIVRPMTNQLWKGALTDPEAIRDAAVDGLAAAITYPS